MKNIVAKGIFNSEEQLINGSSLDENAVPIKEPETASGMFVKGILLFLPAAAVMIALTVIRIVLADMMPKKMSIGMIAVFMISMGICVILSSVHEYIHALLFPADAEKQIWRQPEQNAMFVYCTAKVSKKRFILICIAPAVILGWIPFIVWLAAAALLPAAVSFGLLITSWTMTLMAIGDYANIRNVLRQVPKNAAVFNYGLHTFYTAG